MDYIHFNEDRHSPVAEEDTFKNKVERFCYSYGYGLSILILFGILIFIIIKYLV